MNKKFKIAVYAICKNEEKFVDLYVESMKEADAIFILDTGSTDNTVEKFRKYPFVKIEQKIYDKFRFDIARNDSLDLIDKDFDICVCTDLDERFEPGWREKLEEVWNENVKQAYYRYTWNFDKNGNEGYVFNIGKIHSRNDFIWEHPVHEVLKFVGKEYQQVFVPNVQLNHYADNFKSRKFYLELLELSVEEKPLDDRNLHYLAREYYFNGMWEKSIITFQKHLNLPTSKWKEERANSYRYMSKCYLNLNSVRQAKNCLYLALNEVNTLREPYLDLAKIFYAEQNYLGALFYVTEALKIKNRSNSYINEPDSWNEYIYDLGGFCAIKLKDYKLAKIYLEKALEFAPNDERIKNNYNLVIEKIKK